MKVSVMTLWNYPKFTFCNDLFKFLLLFVCVGAPAWAQTASSLTGPLIIEKQGSFFVGGREQTSSSLGPLNFSAMPGSLSMPGTITVDQIYVRYQIPPAAARPNIILIHGCCLTGKTWETTPDGRMGWDEYFVRRGFPTYVIDQSWRGRSASDPSSINAVHDGSQSPDTLLSELSASHEGAWVQFRFGPKYGETFPDEKFPVAAVADFWKQMVPDFGLSLPTPNPTVPSLSVLAKRIGPSILVGHSQSGIYPFQAVAIDKKDIVRIISIEPIACPSAAGDVSPYTGTPILLLFGDNTAVSPKWDRTVKSCSDFVNAVQKAGGSAKIVLLPQIGIKGNSHMVMQDTNNLEVADFLIDWISKNS